MTKRTWTATFSARRFDVLRPRAGDVHLIDVAHHLSLRNRYGGATLWPYSVAEHAVRVADLLKAWGHGPPVQAQGLHHDSGEAYLPDVPSPYKDALPGFCKLEGGVLAVIADRFCLPPVEAWHPDVWRADRTLLADEVAQLMMMAADEFELPEPRAFITIEPWSAAQAEARFHGRHQELVSAGVLRG